MNTIKRHVVRALLLACAIVAGNGCYSAGGYLRDHVTGAHLQWGLWDYQGHAPYTTPRDDTLMEPQITIE